MDQEFYEQTDAYLRGTMSDTERHAFENRLETDPDLKREVDLVRDLQEATADPDILRFRQELLASIRSGGNGNRGGRWILLSVFLLVAMVSTFLLLSRSPAPNPPDASPFIPQNAPELPESPSGTEPVIEQDADFQFPASQDPPIADRSENTANDEFLAMANDLYAGQPYSITLRGEPGTAPKDRMQEAEEAYRKEAFPEVTDLLRELPTDQVNEARKLRAHSAFRSGNYALAISDFEALRSGFYRYDAEWYLLLSRLALLPNERSAFDALLDSILENPGHPFREKALRLSEDL